MQEQGSSASFRHVDGSSEALFEQAPLLLKAQLNRADGGHEAVTVLVNQLLATDVDDVAQAAHGWTTVEAYVRAKRRAQMQFLATLLRTRQAANSRERIVVMGGFESNEFGDGQDDLMGLLTGRTNGRAGLFALTNMTLQMPKQQRYSVIREGNAEAVDHIVVSQSMLAGPYKLRTEYARINADFGEDNTGAFDVPVRVSDHDAVVLYLTKP
jgi:predicted extracellular nuclease